MLPTKVSLENSEWSDKLRRPIGVFGTVPVLVVLERLIKVEVLKGLDVESGDTVAVVLREGATVGEAIRAVEEALGVVVTRQGRLERAYASHSVEGPDEAGRATSGERIHGQRGGSVLRFWFTRGGVGGSSETLAAAASGQVYVFSAYALHGVRQNWGQTSERDYTEGSVSTDTGRFVATTRKSVSAGLTVEALVGAVPGRVRRIEGRLTISAFDGPGTTKASVNIPLQIDLEEGERVKVYDLFVGDASIAAALRGLGLKVSAGVDRVSVEVRVDG